MEPWEPCTVPPHARCAEATQGSNQVEVTGEASPHAILQELRGPMIWLSAAQAQTIAERIPTVEQLGLPCWVPHVEVETP